MKTILFASGFCVGLLFLSGCASHGPAPSEAASRSASAIEQRPGLGTGFGERLDSPVRPTRFARQNQKTPDGTGRIYYNDSKGVAAMASAAGKARPLSHPLKVAGGLVSIGVKDARGRWLPGRYAGGFGFVEGREGERYEVLLKNESHARVEVVLSVDGLDVMDGQPASYQKRGYVLGAGESVLVDGFRTGPDAVAAFRFSSVADSYTAQRHQTARNVGVIGVAAFVEKGSDPWSSESWRRKTADPFPGRKWATEP